jgi:two-component system phosphate regulon response regulator OmpR
MAAPVRVLIVDDEPGIRMLLTDYLGRQGFEILTADDAGSARRHLDEQTVDIAILDIRMPGEDGLSLARFIREHYTTGIIMLTAADALTDRIVGLEIGADDYLTKPFDPRELLARIKSLLRRMQNGTDADEPAAEVMAVTAAHEYVLETEHLRLRMPRGREITLTQAERELLQIFFEYPNQALSRERLFELVYRREWDPLDRSIDVRITRLRRKIETNPRKPQVIKTIHRKGYMFVVDPESALATTDS